MSKTNKIITIFAVTSLMIVGTTMTVFASKSTSAIKSAPTTKSASTTKSVSTSAGLVLYENEYKIIKLFSKSDLEELTGVQLTNKNAEKMRTALISTEIWLEAGYDQQQAEYITNRFEKSKQQAQGILKKIAKNTKLGLKVIVIDKGYTPQVNLGVESYYQGEGNKDTVESNTVNNSGNNDANSEVNNEKLPSKQEGTTLSDIKKLQIEIEYSKKDVELEYKYDNLKNCEYSNEFTGEELEKNDAVKLAESVLKDIDLRSASKQEIAKQVIERLGVGSNYKKFSFEVKYLDGSKYEFKLKK